MPTTDTLNRETTLCISLAARPSNLGTRFHNYLYDELGLDFVYKAFAPTDIAAAVAGIRGLGIRGAGVSMPYKEVCIPLLDDQDPTAADIDSVTPIVNTDGRLGGEVYALPILDITEIIEFRHLTVVPMMPSRIPRRRKYR